MVELFGRAGGKYYWELGPELRPDLVDRGIPKYARLCHIVNPTHRIRLGRRAK